MENIDILTTKEGNVRIFIPEIVNGSLFSRGGTYSKIILKKCIAIEKKRDRAIEALFLWFEKLLRGTKNYFVF